MKFTMLRAAMMGAGYKQSEVATAIGLGAISFSHRMTAKLPFTMEEAYRIMDLLHLPYNEINTYFPRGGKENG